jgi:anti-sigma factor RsiW
MNRLGHRRMRRTVSAFVDGQLDAIEAAVVAAHVRACWECSGDVEVVRLIKRSLRNLAGRERDALAAARLRRFAGKLR